jgi:anti-sigma regulatory factor (Ser/Thr protein kinase)
MTSMTSPGFRQLASFTVRSEPGNERLALAQVAEAVAGEGLSPGRLERLKTAVAETAMNAIEHGNRNQPEVPVDVEVTVADGDIVVTITDQGGAPEGAGPRAEPDLAAKLAGEQDPRGWGLFLVRHMVDEMNVMTEGTRHTVRLVMRAAGRDAEPANGPVADGATADAGEGGPREDHV